MNDKTQAPAAPKTDAETFRIANARYAASRKTAEDRAAWFAAVNPKK